MYSKSFENFVGAIICVIAICGFVLLDFLCPVKEVFDSQEHEEECPGLHVSVSKVNSDTATFFVCANELNELIRPKAHSFGYRMKYDADFRKNFRELFIISFGVLSMFYVVKFIYHYCNYN